MSETHDPEIVTLEPVTVALLRETVRMDDLTDYYDRAFHAVADAAEAQGVALAGPPVGVYFGMPTETVDVGAGFPTDVPVTPDAGVTPETLPGGPAVRVLHVGTYDAMAATYERLLGWLAVQGLKPGPLMWEVYLTEPDPDAPEASQTLIVWPMAE